MPSRLWHHGVYKMLRVLRYRLPESRECMVTFIYMAYSMLGTLHDTVPIFQTTWIECLGRIFYVPVPRTSLLTAFQGDLGAYRMAIETDESETRRFWMTNSRSWYMKAAHRSPNHGRLYYRLATLAPPSSLEHLSLVVRALTCIAPFEKARESIKTWFNSNLHAWDTMQRPSWETTFIRAHAILFTSEKQHCEDGFESTLDMLVNDVSIPRSCGAFVATTNLAALFEYNTPEQSAQARLRQAYEKAQIAKDLTVETNINLDCDEDLSSDHETSSIFVARASRLALKTLESWMRYGRSTGSNLHSLVHVYLVFIRSLIKAQEAWKSFDKNPIWRTIERDTPWYLICRFLNTVAGELTWDWLHPGSKIFAEDFPKGQKPRPLPEDYTLRGHVYAQGYFPKNWFADAEFDCEEEVFELHRDFLVRIERTLWLGNIIASVCRTPMNSYANADWRSRAE